MSMRSPKKSTAREFNLTKEWVTVKLDCNAETAYVLISIVPYHTVTSRALWRFFKSACPLKWHT